MTDIVDRYVLEGDASDAVRALKELQGQAKTAYGEISKYASDAAKAGVRTDGELGKLTKSLYLQEQQAQKTGKSVTAAMIQSALTVELLKKAIQTTVNFLRDGWQNAEKFAQKNSEMASSIRDVNRNLDTLDIAFDRFTGTLVGGTFGKGTVAKIIEATSDALEGLSAALATVNKAGGLKLLLPGGSFLLSDEEKKFMNDIVESGGGAFSDAFLDELNRNQRDTERRRREANAPKAAGAARGFGEGEFLFGGKRTTLSTGDVEGLGFEVGPGGGDARFDAVFDGENADDFFARIDERDKRIAEQAELQQEHLAEIELTGIRKRERQRKEEEDKRIALAQDMTGTLVGIAETGIGLLIAGEEFAGEKIAQLFLKSVGDKMVGTGIADINEGIARGIRSYGADPTAYTLGAQGAAEIAAGIGLGAAAQAIPTSAPGGDVSVYPDGAGPTPGGPGSSLGSGAGRNSSEPIEITVNFDGDLAVLGRLLQDARVEAERRLT